MGWPDQASVSGLISSAEAALPGFVALWREKLSVSCDHIHRPAAQTSKLNSAGDFSLPGEKAKINERKANTATN